MSSTLTIDTYLTDLMIFFPMNKNIVYVIAVAAIGAAVYFFTPLFDGDGANDGGDSNQTETNSTQ